MRYFVLALEAGDALSDAGLPVAWATCPDLPGAYEEAPTADEALQQLRALAHHIIADHTFVPDEMRGTGAGKRLVERLVADSRAGKVKVTPLCPFVKSMYLRHPEWSDVFG